MAEFPRKLTLSNGSEIDLIEKPGLYRYGNPSKVRMEIRYGTDDSIFQLRKVFVDYLKTPQHIRLTQELIDRTSDTSLIIEFPDYVCQEIINELVHLIMENAGDQRLSTHVTMTNTIANPASSGTSSGTVLAS